MPERVTRTGEIDPDGALKDDAEARLAAFMAGTLYDQYYAMFDELDETQPAMPDTSFWDTWRNIMLTFLVVELAGMATESVYSAVDQSNIGIDWDFVIKQSENWASTYAFNLVTGINDTTRNLLQRNLTKFYAGELDFDGLRTALEKTYSPVRANIIAVTEVTRGFERGKDIYEDGLRFFGFETDRVWWTMDDGDVCVICEPNHGKLRDRDGWTVISIPAHPNDRCWSEVVTVRAARSYNAPNWPRKAAVRHPVQA